MRERLGTLLKLPEMASDSHGAKAAENTTFMSRRGRVESGEEEFERLDSDGEGVWRECQRRLRDELPKGDYDGSIRPLKAEWEEGELLLLAPNQYVEEDVANRHLPRIEELVSQLGATDVRGVKVAIGREPPEPGKPFPPSQAGRRVRRGALGNGAEQGTGLNVNYVFNTFVEGKSNELAKAAAMQLADGVGRTRETASVTYNPLFLYGGVGLGKTHLIHAIGNEVLLKVPDMAVVYLPSERFGNEIVRGVRTHTMQEVTQRYRSVDLLLIDDIQFFADRTGFQGELFHLFNAVLERGSQIVLSSDRYPTRIDGLEARLKSRFAGGLTVEVDMPELETRVAILQNKGEAAGIDIPSDVAFHIAERIRSNVRELEGALARVLATAQLRHAPVTMELVRHALRDLFAIQARQITIAHIQHRVADYYRVKHSDMLSQRRTRAIARPRQMAMCLAKEFTDHSLPEIGEQFGGRDHTTVLYACRKITKLRESSPDIAEDYRNLVRLLNN